MHVESLGKPCDVNKRSQNTHLVFSNCLYWCIQISFLELLSRWMKPALLCPSGHIRIHHECEGGIDKSVRKITNGHHEACQVMAICDREGRIFLSHPHTNMPNGFYFLLTTKYRILYWKRHEKGFQKILKTIQPLCLQATG